jgi:hypothetical protein
MAGQVLRTSIRPVTAADSNVVFPSAFAFTLAHLALVAAIMAALPAALNRLLPFPSL